MDIRELGPADDPEALLDLSIRAFGPIPQADRPRWHHSASAAVGARQYLGAFDGGRLLAAARYHDMIQWWHGQPVPMAGVASVTVAPEERGRGTGRALMGALLGLIGDRGYLVSALYPATLALYRSLGWEIAGGLIQLAIPSRSLRSLVPPDATLPRDEPPDPGSAARPGAEGAAAPLRAADAAEVLAVIGRVHQALRDSGPNTRDESVMARWLGDERALRLPGRRTGSSPTAGSTATTSSWSSGPWPARLRPPGPCGAWSPRILLSLTRSGRLSVPPTRCSG